MDTLDCIATRRSVRKFLDIPVEFEKLGNILDAGRYAPSAGNLQDCKFIVITDEDAREQVAKACLEQYWISTAPLIIIICGESSKTKRYYHEQGEKYSIQNGAIAAENMMLAAHSQGLASCFVGAFTEEILRSKFAIPDDVLIHAVLPIGYPDEKPPEPTRLTLENVIFLDSWGNRVKDLAAYMEWYGEHVQKAVQKGVKAVKKFVRKLQQ